jgi:hypothetical protein
MGGGGTKLVSNTAGLTSWTCDSAPSGSTCTPNADKTLTVSINSGVSMTVTANYGAAATPVPTSAPSNTNISLIVGLDGVGTTGDNKNSTSNSSSTKSPTTTTENVTVEAFDSTNTSVSKTTGTVTYDSVTTDANYGKFTGTIPLNSTIKAGSYIIKVTVDGHLTRTLGLKTITTGTNTMQAVTAVAGDIVITPSAEANKLNLNDYNVLMSCMTDSNFDNPDNGALCATDPTYAAKSDLDNNGTVDMFDYNLFLREYSVQHGD